MPEKDISILFKHNPCLDIPAKESSNTKSIPINSACLECFMLHYLHTNFKAIIFIFVIKRTLRYTILVLLGFQPVFT